MITKPTIKIFRISFLLCLYFSVNVCIGQVNSLWNRSFTSTFEINSMSGLSNPAIPDTTPWRMGLYILKNGPGGSLTSNLAAIRHTAKSNTISLLYHQEGYQVSKSMCVAMHLGLKVNHTNTAGVALIGQQFRVVSEGSSRRSINAIIGMNWRRNRFKYAISLREFIPQSIDSNPALNLASQVTLSGRSTLELKVSSQLRGIVGSAFYRQHFSNGLHLFLVSQSTGALLGFGLIYKPSKSWEMLSQSTYHISQGWNHGAGMEWIH